MHAKDWLLFSLLALIWGSSFLWIKIAVQEVGPVTLVAYRLLFGAVGLIAIVAIKRPPMPRERRTWLTLLVLGFTNTAVPFVLISWGETHIDSGVASILNGTVPLFTLLIAHFILHDERMTWMRFAGLMAGFGGVVALMSRDVGPAGFDQSIVGQLAVLGAAICYAGSSVFARRNLGDVAPMFQALMIVLVADTALWLSVPAVESPVIVPRNPLTWLALAWLGLLGSCVAYLIYFGLIQRAGPTRTVMVTYVMPIVGVLLGVTFLNEPLDWRLGLGTALVASGVWAVNRRTQRSAPASPPAPSD
ncbi:MAG: DMT family transporter [Candidatus Bipolaricaulia bacterium]